MSKAIIQGCVSPKGVISPVSSKSISNRALIIDALLGNTCELQNLSDCDDTATLVALLQQIREAKSAVTLNTGPAGTVMRFLTTYCCLSGKEIILTGSDRMLSRPIKQLVDALKGIGATVDYVGKTGYPPLHIKPGKIKGGKLSVDASVSSQFISSLMLCAPYFEEGITLELTGNIVSFSYIELTQQVMREFGIEASIQGNSIYVPKGKYKAIAYTIEGDWSSASYFYALAALSKSAEIELLNFSMASQQGDKAIAAIAQDFGVSTEAKNGGIVLRKTEVQHVKPIYDFTLCPDIAQTVAVMAAGCGVKEVKFTGVSTLKVKETDRVAALQTELSKFGVEITIEDVNNCIVRAEGIRLGNEVVQTYDDHRMAMSFAVLAQRGGEITIEHPNVVNKSYRGYWRDIIRLGCLVENTDI